MHPASVPDMNETLIGHTTRPIHFAYVEHGTRIVREIRKAPAGTEVYVRESKRRGLVARIPGSLFEQRINWADVEPA